MIEKPEKIRSDDRFNASVDLQFSFSYDLEADLEYQILEDQSHQKHQEKYAAKSKNISSHGLCFYSPVELHKGDKLKIELSLAPMENEVEMEGQVCWSKKDKKQYETGLELTTVTGKPVDETIYFDKEYHVYWSIVLESVLGKYREYIDEKKIEKPLQDD